MTTYYTNSPGRFGTCYATHDPSASQATVTTPVTPPVVITAAQQNYVGGKRRGYKFTPFNPGRLQAEISRQEAAKERTAIQEAFAKAAENIVVPEVKAEPINPDVSFTSVTVDESLVPGIEKRLAEYEALADELQEKTKKRLAELALMREEEELIVMLLAQDI